MQSLSWCKYYTQNTNPNKTCKNKKRCIMWSDDCYCYEYEEKEDQVSYSYKGELNNGR